MRVLFIGNSHTYVNDMPRIFADICRKNGVDSDVTMLSHPGMGWDYHVNQPEVRFNILHGRYDAVVLQHVAHPMGDLTVMYENGCTLIDWVREAGSRPVLYMTWAAMRDGSAFQPVMSSAYRRLEQEKQCAVAPVGEAWWHLAALTSVEGMYAPDGEHASLLGSTLAAYTIASVILKKPARELAGDDETARLIARAIDGD